MTEKELIEQLFNASPYMATAAVVLIAIWRASSIIDAFRGAIAAWNDGAKERADSVAEIQNRAINAGTEAIEKALAAMTRTLESQQRITEEARRYSDQRYDDMRSGMSLLEGRIHDLEKQNEDKDKIIKEQGDRIKELERENTELRGQVDKLKQKLDVKEARKKNAKGLPSPIPASA